MAEDDFHTELTVEMLCHALCTIDAAVLSACTSERNHEAGEVALDEAFGVEVDERIDVLEETEYLTVFLEEVDDGLVKSCHVLEFFVTAWVVGASAVEHITASMSALVLGHSVLERETEHLDHE